MEDKPREEKPREVKSVDDKPSSSKPAPDKPVLDKSPDKPKPSPSRARNRRRLPSWWPVALGVVAVVILAIIFAATRTDDTPSSAAANAVSTATIGTNTSAVVAAPPIPQACIDAFAIARLTMDNHVQPLIKAANDHYELMRRLELFIHNKPGGINGPDALKLGMGQMKMFQEHGPDAQVQVDRFKELAAQCPLR